jgi:hypothetical protein
LSPLGLPDDISVGSYYHSLSGKPWKSGDQGAGKVSVSSLEPKLHETGKCLEVSEMGTSGNMTLQKWKRRGKCRIYIYIYIYIYI